MPIHSGTIRLLAAMSITAVLTGPAFAQTQAAAGPPSAQGRQRMPERFEAANTTHDGRLTLAQARAGHMPRVAQYFSVIDADHKGYVTIRDIKLFRKSQAASPQAPQPMAQPN